MRYSPSTRGFYMDDGDAPGDVVEVSNERYRELLNQSAETGMMIAPGDDGNPVLVPPPERPVTPASVAARVSELIKKATLEIEILNSAAHLGGQLDGDPVRIDELERYRVALYRIDPNDAPDVTIPEYP